jgi:hypothetical protein
MSNTKPQQKWRSVDPTARVNPNSRPAHPVRQAPRTFKGDQDIRQTKAYKAAARRYVQFSFPRAYISCFLLVWFGFGRDLTNFVAV